MSKMKRAKIVKLSLDELAGVDSGAQAEAGDVILKRRDERTPATATMKRSAITSAVLGHSHLIAGIDDMQSGCTSSERTYDPNVVTGDSYYSYHSHAWVRSDDGTIVLGESAGHTHELGVIAGTRATKGAVKSPPAIEPTKVDTMTTKFVVLTEAQGSHLAKLSTADQEAFLAKSSVERESDVQKAIASDPIVFQGEVTKTVVRRSDGDLAKRLAEQAESGAVELAKAKIEITKANDARDLSELRKRATDTIGKLAGSDDAHVALMKAAESIADEKVRGEAITALKAANAVMVEKSKASGVGGVGDPQNLEPVAAWNAAVSVYAEKNGIKDLGKAEDRFLSTSEGLVAKRAYDKGAAEMRRQQDF